MIHNRAARAPLVARLLLACALAASSFSWARAEEPDYPAPTGYVVDAAGLLDEATRTRIEAIAREVDEKTTAQIAVAVVPSIAPLEVEDYAVELFKRWGVGSKKEDLGVLLVVAQQERRVRIEVGYGLEPILPDGRVGGILRSSVVPHLRHDDWNAGVLGGVEALAAIIAKDRGVELQSLAGVEPPPDEDPESERVRIPMSMLLILGGIFLFAIMSGIASGGRRNRSRRRGWGGWYVGPGGFGGFSGGGSGGGFGGFGGGSSGGGGASSGF